MLRDTKFEDKSGVYKIENTITNTVYIGLSVDMNRRKIEHINESRNEDSKGYNKLLYKAFREFGLESFRFEVLEYSEDIHKLNELEDKYIEKYDSIAEGYNSDIASPFTYTNKPLKSSTMVEIINKYTGEFIVFEKLAKGKPMKYGNGVNDVRGIRRFNSNDILKRAYVFWCNRLSLCYNKQHKQYKTYGGRGVELCEEWLVFSNCLKWYIENYIEGYELDKDGLSGECESRIYSPNTCQFLPKEENLKLCGLFISKQKEYYESKATLRAHFKSVCANNGWDFGDFVEVKSEVKNLNGQTIYFYFYNPTEARELNKNRVTVQQRDIKPYEGIENRYVENSCRRDKFKNYCKRNGLMFEDFEEIYCGEKQGTNKLFFYIHKNK